jgi:hypothetical protein
MVGTWISKAMGALVPMATAAALISAGQAEPRLPQAHGHASAFQVSRQGEARLAGKTLASPRVHAHAALNPTVPPPADEHGPVAVLPSMQVMPRPLPPPPGREGGAMYGVSG